MTRRTEGRQQPGYACEDCRTKKIRCDRRRPQCSPCAESGISCHVNDRRVSRARSARGDWRRQEDVSSVPRNEHHADTDTTLTEPSPAISQPSPRVNVPTPSLPIPVTEVDTLVRADLTQLYFDRAHPIVPILNPARTLQWMSSPVSTLDEYQRCLRHAMWTMAAAYSSQFHETSKIMYDETKAMLESLDLGIVEAEHRRIEHVQAWLLVTYYELIMVSYRRGWLSAGRVFRLIQLLKLYEVDNPATWDSGVSNQPVEMEEKRRVFWAGYCLDHFNSIGEGAPTTLSEDNACTRLPCLESDFENGAIKEECFISEATTSDEIRPYSPLAECAIICTLGGRTLAHRQVSTMEVVLGNDVTGFWGRHDWIYAMLTHRIASLQTHHPNLGLASDPLLLFTYLSAQTLITYLSYIMDPLMNDEENKALVRDFHKRGMTGALEIARLAQQQESLGLFKAHTFMAKPFFLSAARLVVLKELWKSELGEDELQEIESGYQTSLRALDNLTLVNKLAEHYRTLLDKYAKR